MLPCAIEYFQTTTKHLPVGRHVGLQGSALERLTAAREGMPTYVWPTKPMIEHDLLRAGMSALTDHADPSLTWLPSGHARWRRPGLQPLLEAEWSNLSELEKQTTSRPSKPWNPPCPRGLNATQLAGAPW